MEDTAKSFLPEEMLKAAFTLNRRRYFSDAYAMDDRYGVLIYNGRISPEIPAYASIADTVKADYLAEKKKYLFNEEGNRLNAELKKRMQTEPFTPAAKSLGLKVTEHNTFKIGEAPGAISQAVLQQAQKMQPGEISPMLTVEDRGMFVYLKEKTVPEITDENEKLIQAKDFLRQYSSFTSYNSILNELVASGLNEKE